MNSNASLSSFLQVITGTSHTFLTYLSWILASWRRPRSHQTRIVCLSDTHSQQCPVPDGDILTHAGDMSQTGSAADIQETINWLKTLPHRHKVVVAGNSDLFFDARSRLPEDMALCSDKESSSCQDDVSSIFDWGDIHYLQGTSVTLDCSPIDTESPDRVSGSVPRYLKIYGAPYVPECGPDHENAFQYPVTHNAWNGKIPPSTDILVTHTPPKYHLDWDFGSPEGCAFLLDEVRKVRPLLHVFGHVHASYGAERVIWNKAQLRWEGFCAEVQELQRQDGVKILRRVKLGLDATMVLLSGVWDLLGSLIVTGRLEGQSTLMVNAACMKEDEKLGNEPRLVYL
ncbi:Metallo-dependent phosphatase [Aspergillus steynii IBT 23096]|uniref:Metallo-dependent phosphatase n=1 Tax=Aspergillus steynii IBT 23096 TaxID=1392250 RepID=A0A2I2GC63_9EURO|nr:Metallo-dependent phosphatase [Aspergillus steynii IBT 23096]PLB50471.1 Metallo-dependent phosphatase [Aspergillus steynii IBT 23096]